MSRRGMRSASRFKDPLNLTRCFKFSLTTEGKSNRIFISGAPYFSRNQSFIGRAVSLGKMLHSLRARVRAFLPDAKANTAMMFGLSLVPILVATGAGIDF